MLFALGYMVSNSKEDILLCIRKRKWWWITQKQYSYLSYKVYSQYLYRNTKTISLYFACIYLRSKFNKLHTVILYESMVCLFYAECILFINIAFASVWLFCQWLWKYDFSKYKANFNNTNVWTNILGAITAVKYHN